MKLAVHLYIMATIMLHESEHESYRAQRWQAALSNAIPPPARLERCRRNIVAISLIRNKGAAFNRAVPPH
jgi:hypothetical protein